MTMTATCPICKAEHEVHSLTGGIGDECRVCKFLRPPEAVALQDGQYGLRVSCAATLPDGKKLRKIMVYEKETMCTIREFWIDDEVEES